MIYKRNILETQFHHQDPSEHHITQQSLDFLRCHKWTKKSKTECATFGRLLLNLNSGELHRKSLCLKNRTNIMLLVAIIYKSLTKIYMFGIVLLEGYTPSGKQPMACTVYGCYGNCCNTQTPMFGKGWVSQLWQRNAFFSAIVGLRRSNFAKILRMYLWRGIKCVLVPLPREDVP